MSLKHIQKLPVFNFQNLSRCASTKSSTLNTLITAEYDPKSLDRTAFFSPLYRSRSLSPNFGNTAPFLLNLTSPAASSQQIYKNPLFVDPPCQSCDNLTLPPPLVTLNNQKQSIFQEIETNDIIPEEQTSRTPKVRFSTRRNARPKTCSVFLKKLNKLFETLPPGIQEADVKSVLLKQGFLLDKCITDSTNEGNKDYGSLCKRPGHRRRKKKEDIKEEEGKEEEEDEDDDEPHHKSAKSSREEDCERVRQKYRKSYCRHAHQKKKKDCVIPGGKPNTGITCQNGENVHQEIELPPSEASQALNFIFGHPTAYNKSIDLEYTHQPVEIKEPNFGDVVNYSCGGCKRPGGKASGDDPCNKKDTCKGVQNKTALVEEGCKRYKEKHRRKDLDHCKDKLKKDDPCKKKRKRKSDRCKKSNDPCSKKKKKSPCAKKCEGCNSGGGSGSRYLNSNHLSLMETLQNENVLARVMLDKNFLIDPQFTSSNRDEVFSGIGRSDEESKESSLNGLGKIYSFNKADILRFVDENVEEEVGDKCDKMKKIKSDFHDDCLNQISRDKSWHKDDINPSCAERKSDPCVYDPCSQPCPKSNEDPAAHRYATEDPCSYIGPRKKRSRCNPDNIPDHRSPCKKASNISNSNKYYLKGMDTENYFMELRRKYSKIASGRDDQDPSAKMLKEHRMKLERKKKADAEAKNKKKKVPKFAFKCPQVFKKKPGESSGATVETSEVSPDASSSTEAGGTNIDTCLSDALRTRKEGDEAKHADINPKNPCDWVIEERARAKKRAASSGLISTYKEENVDGVKMPDPCLSFALKERKHTGVDLKVDPNSPCDQNFIDSQRLTKRKIALEKSIKEDIEKIKDKKSQKATEQPSGTTPKHAKATQEATPKECKSEIEQKLEDIKNEAKNAQQSGKPAMQNEIDMWYSTSGNVPTSGKVANRCAYDPAEKGGGKAFVRNQNPKEKSKSPSDQRIQRSHTLSTQSAVEAAKTEFKKNLVTLQTEQPKAKLNTLTTRAAHVHDKTAKEAEKTMQTVVSAQQTKKIYTDAILADDVAFAKKQAEDKERLARMQKFRAQLEECKESSVGPQALQNIANRGEKICQPKPIIQHYPTQDSSKIADKLFEPPKIPPTQFSPSLSNSMSPQNPSGQSKATNVVFATSRNEVSRNISKPPLTKISLPKRSRSAPPSKHSSGGKKAPPEKSGDDWKMNLAKQIGLKAPMAVCNLAKKILTTAGQGAIKAAKETKSAVATAAKSSGKASKEGHVSKGSKSLPSLFKSSKDPLPKGKVGKVPVTKEGNDKNKEGDDCLKKAVAGGQRDGGQGGGPKKELSKGDKDSEKIKQLEDKMKKYEKSLEGLLKEKEEREQQECEQKKCINLMRTAEEKLCEKKCTCEEEIECKEKVRLKYQTEDEKIAAFKKKCQDQIREARGECLEEEKKCQAKQKQQAIYECKKRRCMEKGTCEEQQECLKQLEESFMLQRKVEILEEENLRLKKLHDPCASDKEDKCKVGGRNPRKKQQSKFEQCVEKDNDECPQSARKGDPKRTRKDDKCLLEAEPDPCSEATRGNLINASRIKSQIDSNDPCLKATQQKKKGRSQSCELDAIEKEMKCQGMELKRSKSDPCGKSKDTCKKKVTDPCKRKQDDKCGKDKDPCKKKKEDKCKKDKDPCKKKDDPCKKKDDPCKKKDDPCKKKDDPCKKKDDPCKKKDDPCKKKDDPCKKKDDPCKKKDDPCKKKDDPCKKKDDPCKKKDDPCKKKDDPCKQKDDPCKKKDDPCKKKDDPCKKKDDPCKKKDDPCKKKDDPCKKKDDPCKKSDPCKKKDDPCKKKDDPCKKKDDPCKKSDPCKKKGDPCKKKDDPCKKKSDPCKKKSDTCSKKSDPCKKKSDTCSKKSDPGKKKSDTCSKKDDSSKEKADPCPQNKFGPSKKKSDTCMSDALKSKSDTGKSKKSPCKTPGGKSKKCMSSSELQKEKLPWMDCKDEKTKFDVKCEPKKCEAKPEGENKCEAKSKEEVDCKAKLEEEKCKAESEEQKKCEEKAKEEEEQKKCEEKQKQEEQKKKCEEKAKQEERIMKEANEQCEKPEEKKDRCKMEEETEKLRKELDAFKKKEQQRRVSECQDKKKIEECLKKKTCQRQKSQQEIAFEQQKVCAFSKCEDKMDKGERDTCMANAKKQFEEKQKEYDNQKKCQEMLARMECEAEIKKEKEKEMEGEKGKCMELKDCSQQQSCMKELEEKQKALKGESGDQQSCKELLECQKKMGDTEKQKELNEQKEYLKKRKCEADKLAEATKECKEDKDKKAKQVYREKMELEEQQKLVQIRNCQDMEAKKKKEQEMKKCQELTDKKKKDDEAKEKQKQKECQGAVAKCEEEMKQKKKMCADAFAQLKGLDCEESEANEIKDCTKRETALKNLRDKKECLAKIVKECKRLKLLEDCESGSGQKGSGSEMPGAQKAAVKCFSNSAPSKMHFFRPPVCHEETQNCSIIRPAVPISKKEPEMKPAIKDPLSYFKICDPSTRVVIIKEPGFVERILEPLLQNDKAKIANASESQKHEDECEPKEEKKEEKTGRDLKKECPVEEKKPLCKTVCKKDPNVITCMCKPIEDKDKDPCNMYCVGDVCGPCKKYVIIEEPKLKGKPPLCTQEACNMRRRCRVPPIEEPNCCKKLPKRPEFCKNICGKPEKLAAAKLCVPKIEPPKEYPKSVGTGGTCSQGVCKIVTKEWCKAAPPQPPSKRIEVDPCELSIKDSKACACGQPPGTFRSSCTPLKGQDPVDPCSDNICETKEVKACRAKLEKEEEELRNRGCTEGSKNVCIDPPKGKAGDTQRGTDLCVSDALPHVQEMMKCPRLDKKRPKLKEEEKGMVDGCKLFIKNVCAVFCPGKGPKSKKGALGHSSIAQEVYGENEYHNYAHVKLLAAKDDDSSNQNNNPSSWPLVINANGSLSEIEVAKESVKQEASLDEGTKSKESESEQEIFYDAEPTPLEESRTSPLAEFKQFPLVNEVSMKDYEDQSQYEIYAMSQKARRNFKRFQQAKMEDEETKFNMNVMGPERLFKQRVSLDASASLDLMETNQQKKWARDFFEIEAQREICKRYSQGTRVREVNSEPGFGGRRTQSEFEEQIRKRKFFN